MKSLEARDQGLGMRCQGQHGKKDKRAHEMIEMIQPTFASALFNAAKLFFAAVVGS